MVVKRKPANPRRGQAGSRAAARPKTQTTAKPPAAATKATRKPPAAASAATPKRTMPVHALADERVHLAMAQPGRLRQGYLRTLCALQAVSALSPFALADPAQKRCRTCFGKVDADGMTVG